MGDKIQTSWIPNPPALLKQIPRRISDADAVTTKSWFEK